MLEIRAVRRLPAFTLDVAFESGAGITALFGRSGSGKTTLVNAIAGLIRPDDGRIAVDGECLFDAARGIDLPVERRRVGYVFQDARLFPHLTVRDNLRYGYERVAPAARYVEFDHVVELLDIAPLLARRPARLSGGEKQRVAIGRALLASPRLLLMDEPLAALDGERKREVLHYIERLHAEVKVPIVYVTHAVEEIVRLAETVVLMAGGRVVARGAVGEVMGRADLRGQTGIFEGGAVIETRVAARDAAYALATLEFAGGALRVPGVDAAIGAALRVRIRARDVSIALEPPREVSVLNVLAGTITGVDAGDGPSVLVHLDLGGAAIAARVTRYSADRLGLAAGRRVYALIKAVSLA